MCLRIFVPRQGICWRCRTEEPDHSFSVIVGYARQRTEFTAEFTYRRYQRPEADQIWRIGRSQESRCEQIS